MATSILLATTSGGKLREYRDLLASMPVALLSPADLGLSLDVDETGDTFEANADLKAQAYAAAVRAHSGEAVWVLAEDSGLEVEALGGEPGVRSARWAGTDDYQVIMRRLLERLEGVPSERRGCRYVCSVTLVEPSGALHRCEGEVRGRIADVPRGSGGFGYDPLFLVPGLGRTMGELSRAEKDAISHRAHAAECIRRVLTQSLESRG